MPAPFTIEIKIAAGLLLIALTGAVSCGKRKPPLPPVAKVTQRAEISGFQRGNQVILSWRMPEKNAPVGNVQHIKRIDVYRLTEKAASPPSLTEEQFASRSVLIASIKVQDNDFGTKPLSYTDTLQFAGQPSRMRYAVRFVNGAGQKAAFSNFLRIEPEAKVAAAPAGLKGEVTQEAILLTWTAPDINTDRTTPANLLGFNLYRSETKTQAAKLINKAPITDSHYEDMTFEFDKPYFYFVRAVSSAGEKRTESGESNIIELNPKDVFPPSRPVSITIAAAPGVISLFFPPNPETDVTGYKIFRSNDDSRPKSDWELLTPTETDSNTFQDNKVETGKTYFYYVIAVDKFNNESETSEVVSETAL